MEAQHTTDDYVLVTKCEPLGPQRKFQGTWFVGFELSVFRNDYAGVPAEPNGHEYDLVAPALVSGRAHARDRAGVSAYQVTFLGREYQVANKPDPNHLVADRMLSVRSVPVSPGFTGRR